MASVVTAQPIMALEADKTVRFSRELSFTTRIVPLACFFTLLNVTVLIFFFGPWPWSHLSVNPTKLIVFVAAAHIALALGYMSGALKDPRGFNSSWDITRIVTISVIVSLAVLLPTLTYRTGTMVPSVLAAVRDPGAAYTRSLTLRAVHAPVIEYVRCLVGPLLAMCLPLTIFYWKQLPGIVRLGGIINIAGVGLTFIAMGTNKGIADSLLIATFVLLAGLLSKRLTLTFRQKAAIGTILVTGAVCFVLFFTATQYTRKGSAAREGRFDKLGLRADRGNFMVRGLPESAQVGILGLTEYLSHGYYALYLALNKPFVPMYGVGNSYFLFRQAARFLHRPEIMNMPYPLRVQASDGWDAYGLWSTVYPWFASDVSFPGTIVLVFLIGRLFALSWLDTLRGDNPFAVAMFAQFVIMISYFSANNQCLQDGEGLISFFVILSAWLWTRRRRMCQTAPFSANDAGSRS